MVIELFGFHGFPDGSSPENVPPEVLQSPPVSGSRSQITYCSSVFSAIALLSGVSDVLIVFDTSLYGTCLDGQIKPPPDIETKNVDGRLALKRNYTFLVPRIRMLLHQRSGSISTRVNTSLYASTVIMTPNPELFFGPMLLGVFFNTILYGVLVVQIFNYFQVYKSSDKPLIRYLVIYLLVLETFGTACVIHMMYEVFVMPMGAPKPPGPPKPPTSMAYLPLFFYLLIL
ncbi:hypothetical protein AB1N83_009597 [Pleurotus pulmonarius]